MVVPQAASFNEIGEQGQTVALGLMAFKPRKNRALLEHFMSYFRLPTFGAAGLVPAW